MEKYVQIIFDDGNCFIKKIGKQENKGYFVNFYDRVCKEVSSGNSNGFVASLREKKQVGAAAKFINEYQMKKVEKRKRKGMAIC